MYTKAPRTIVRALVGTVCVAATLVAGNAAAKEKFVTVAIQVTTQGLDLNQAADAQTFYTRLQNAAWVACTRGNRTDLLAPVDDLHACVEQALGDAVHATNKRLVTQLYLASHTQQEAAKHGIATSSQLAAK
jgi:UrcA family protein